MLKLIKFIQSSVSLFPQVLQGMIVKFIIFDYYSKFKKVFSFFGLFEAHHA